MAVLFYTSSLPGKKIHLPPFPYSDKAVHFGAYTVLGGLIAWRKRLRGNPGGLDSSGKSVRDLREMRDLTDLRGMAVGMVYGAGDEIHQIFVPDRMFGYSDMGADFLGVAVGVWAFRKLSLRYLTLG